MRIRALVLRLPADPRELEGVWLVNFGGRLRIIGPRFQQALGKQQNAAAI